MRTVELAFFSLLLCACAVDVSLEGKACPCLADYRCVNGTCVPGDAGSGGANNCLMGVGAFHATWTTPHGIRWEWEPIGVEPDFQEYSLVTWPTAAEDQKRTWTSEDNPELGVFNLARTNMPEPVHSTVTGGLKPGTAYSAMIEVKDSGGCVAQSNIGGKSTTDAAPRVSVMHDAPAGSSGNLTYTTSGCYGGSAGCWMGTATATDCGTQATCWENLRREGLGTQLTLTAGAFSTAYIAFDVDDESMTQSWWGNVILYFADPMTAWATEPIIYPTQRGYRTIEVPLAELIDQSTATTTNPVPLTFDKLGGELNVFNVGTELSVGDHVWVDEVQVGW